ncbi:hypothetical protein PI125_g16253 [Phytophthora idaei]|nr:hypothetical protein PI125_g16253 [Phytophthora idaei]
MRQAVRERYHQENDAGEDEDNEVAEEDSEGNKYVSSITKADERPYRGNNETSYTTFLGQLQPITTSLLAFRFCGASRHQLRANHVLIRGPSQPL